jgi:hypothetical protein
MTYLLGFAATGIGNKESTVELNKDFLDFLLGGLIDELLVEGNDSLGKSLTDSVDLGDVTYKISNGEISIQWSSIASPVTHWFPIVLYKNTHHHR